MTPAQEWLADAPPKLLSVLDEVMEWRHRIHLSGSQTRCDSTTGFFGNPRAKTIFVAEIPEVSGIDQAVNYLLDNGRPLDELWTFNWNWSEGDKLFRKALRHHKFIKEGEGDTPWAWDCWITDFVKCPTRTQFWNPKKGAMDGIRRERKQKILDESAALLARELTLLDFDKIVLMGGTVQGWFRRYTRKGVFDVPREKWRHVPHYGRKGGRKRETAFLKEFSEGLKKRVK